MPHTLPHAEIAQSLVALLPEQSGRRESLTAVAGLQPKWTWSCRRLDRSAEYLIDRTPAGPRVSDLVAVRVTRTRFHNRIFTADDQRLRLYPGDVLIGALGNRYATDAFEGEVDSLAELNILTSGGMIGTVRSRHAEMAAPTDVEFLGFVCHPSSARLNLKSLHLRETSGEPFAKPTVLVVGTGMNAGKTTAMAKLIRGLREEGLRVAACKWTGSVSPNDAAELRATGAEFVADFSDYGFPSTYLASHGELLGLFDALRRDASASQPDLTLMEIADGVLQRETDLLLRDPYVRQAASGVVLAASCAPSALYAARLLEERRLPVLVVSGRITSSPLSVREFQSASRLPVGCSVSSGKELAALVRQGLAA